MIALDSRNNMLKKYYLKNITDVKTTDETFSTDKNLDKLLDESISIWFNENKEPYEVKLHIDKKIAKYFRRKLISKSQKILKNHEDGSIDIILFISHDMEIIPLIKYWIPYIKVIEPKSVRDKVLKDIRVYIS